MVTLEQRAEIERLLDEGQLSQNEIAKQIGCSRTAVQNAAKGKPAKAVPFYKQLQSLPSVTMPEPDVWGRYKKDTLPDVVLVIPDLQAPYAHPDALQFLSMVAQRFKPDLVVGIGDEVDFSFLSDHKKVVDIDNPAPELQAAIDFMGRLFKLFPSAVALTSNHVHGRLGNARKNGRIPEGMMKSWREIINAPRGWEWYEEIYLGNYLFRHGDGWPKLNGMQLLRATPDKYGRHYNLVHGHIHSEAGIKAVERVGNEDYFAAYTGCLIDPRAKAFSYTKPANNKLGCLVIIHGVPKRVPMGVDSIGRWNGKL
jgi:hypothetical protein